MARQVLALEQVEVIFCDVDGTLEASGAPSPSSETVIAINGLRPNFVPVTGRTEEDADQMLDELPINYAIINGGTNIRRRGLDGSFDLVDDPGSEIYSPCFKPSVIRRVVARLAAISHQGDLRQIERAGRIILEDLPSQVFDGPLFEGAKDGLEVMRFVGSVLTPMPGPDGDVVDFHRESVRTALAHGGDPLLESIFLRGVSDPTRAASVAETISAEFQDEAVAYSVTAQNPEFNDVQVVGHRATKGHAVRELCRLEGWDPNSCVFIGDGMNDRAGFEAVGWGVAMGNAPDALKMAADLVIGAQSDGGLVEFLQKFSTV
jgi:hydroxymethylpyrimidine pyrophosphatase-like HAD family hydrolase